MATKRLSRMDVFVFMLPILAAVLSAILAKVNFGQPLIFGLGEMRRAFHLWVYFPLVAMIRRDTKTSIAWHQILRHVIIVGTIAASLGLVWLMTGISLAPVTDIDKYVSYLRGDRVLIGGLLPVLSIAGCVALIKEYGFLIKYVIPILISLAYLLLVSQTIQLLVVASIIIGYGLGLRGTFRSKLTFWSLVPLLVIIGAWVIIEAGKLDTYATLIGDRTNLQSLAAGPRAIGLLVGFQHLQHYWFGAGGLAFSWNGGFTRLWSPNFWLSDIGVFGVVFRYGVFALPLVCTLVYLVIRRRRLGDVVTDDFCVLVALMLLLLLPTQDWLSYRGTVLGLLFALKFGRKIRRRTSEALAPNCSGALLPGSYA